MVKEIKEGQQATAAILKQSPDILHLRPTKHCVICSCDSHYTDECSQLQEDNMVAATQDFFEATANPPYNRQYRNQGCQTQNNQNTRYQPPHNRQQPLLANNPPLRYDEAIRIYQKENQEIREIQKRTAEQLAKLNEVLQGITNQPTQVQPLTPSPLSSQLLQNPKGGINAFQNKKKKKGRDEDKSEKESVNLWYDLLAQLADSDDEEEEESEDESGEEYSDESEDDEYESEEESEEESDEDDDDESEEEGEGEDWLYNLLIELNEAQNREKEDGDSEEEEKSNKESEIENVGDNDQNDKGKTFFIATLFNNKRVKEEIPIKCEDPGSCLVTYRIKHAIIRECLCDPGACSSVMPYEIYKFLGLGPLKETKEIFTTADASVVSVKDKGSTPQVLLERPFLKSGGFKLNYYDEIGNAMEIFHFTAIEGRKEKKKKTLSTMEKRKWISMVEEPDFGKKGNKKKLEGRKKKKSRKKKRKGEAEAETDKARIKCSSLSKLFGKLKGLKRLLPQKKGADAHLVKNNSKWKLAALRSNDAVQLQTQTPDVPVKESVTSILPPKKRKNFRMAGHSSRKSTKTPCRRSRRIAALYSTTKPISKENVVIEISDDSVQQEDANLEQGEALPSTEVGGGADLPKNDVYNALWAMLDAEEENEAEKIPGQWDLDSVLQN
ncbi:hypothetical protein PIB30_024461 [Stylosanthes scabra]|uniref:Uncharacterized protein n=1 Tax=Stylosanthes scabra TaxID=79078 RepID=A0ABU6XBB3_9FABA|nr:hypothetical protein [Stylosanthes scabra]